VPVAPCVVQEVPFGTFAYLQRPASHVSIVHGFRSEQDPLEVQTMQLPLTQLPGMGSQIVPGSQSSAKSQLVPFDVLELEHSPVVGSQESFVQKLESEQFFGRKMQPRLASQESSVQRLPSSQSAGLVHAGTPPEPPVPTVPPSPPVPPTPKEPPSPPVPPSPPAPPTPP
jgi:hypothetical protein